MVAIEANGTPKCVGPRNHPRVVAEPIMTRYWAANSDFQRYEGDEAGLAIERRLCKESTNDLSSVEGVSGLTTAWGRRHIRKAGRNIHVDVWIP